MPDQVQLCLNLVNYSPMFGGTVGLEEQIAGVAGSGFTKVGLDVWSIDAYRQGGGTLEDLGELLREANLEPFELVGVKCSHDLADTTAMATSSAHIAGELGIGHVLFFFADQLDEQLFHSFEEACAIVASRNARASLEFMPHSPLATVADARDYVQRVGDRAGVLLDTWHYFRGPNDWSELEQIPLSQIAYVHFDDAPPAVSDDSPHEAEQRRVMPGEGEFELRRFADTLLGRGYSGVVSVEILSSEMRTMPPAEFARRAYERTAPFWT